MRAERAQDVIVSPLSENVKIEPCNEGISGGHISIQQYDPIIIEQIDAAGHYHSFVQVTQSYRVSKCLKIRDPKASK